MGASVRDPGTGQLEVGVSAATSVAQQALTAATLTYIAGSALVIPPSKLKIGSVLRWRFNMAKTAAGSASSTIDLRLGTAGTTADTAIITFTKIAGTAAADEGWFTVDAVVRGPLSSTGKIVATFQFSHNLAATGHATTQTGTITTVSGNVDVTVASLIAGLSITTGAADACTIEQVTAELLNT